jgi:hypothetical protein
MLSVRGYDIASSRDIKAGPVIRVAIAFDRVLAGLIESFGRCFAFFQVIKEG